MLDTAKDLAKDPKWRTRVLEQARGVGTRVRLGRRPRHPARHEDARQREGRRRPRAADAGLKHSIDELGSRCPQLNSITLSGLEGAQRVRGANPPKTKPTAVTTPPPPPERPVWKPKQDRASAQPTQPRRTTRHDGSPCAARASTRRSAATRPSSGSSTPSTAASPTTRCCGRCTPRRTSGPRRSV